MANTILFDLTARHTTPPITDLTAKQFALLVYLALRRTDGGDGWVERDEICERVPGWTDLEPLSVGKAISRLSESSWLDRFVDYEQLTNGRYRLMPGAEFQPSRDAANVFIAHIPMSRSGKRPRRRSFDPVELEAYDLLVQYGVYLQPVVDLILQRVADLSRFETAEQRFRALKILATLYKNRGKTADAKERATEGLALARRLRRNDDVAYFLDQLAGATYIEGDHRRARELFEEEVKFLENWDSPRAKYHLVGANRGLASSLRALGLLDEARAAIERSEKYADESGNADGKRLALIEKTRLGMVPADEASAGAITHDLPMEHLIGRVMATRDAAELLLSRGEREEGAHLLRRAYDAGTRLGLQGTLRRCEDTARKYHIDLPDSAEAVPPP